MAPELVLMLKALSFVADDQRLDSDKFSRENNVNVILL
jgi:hypothetical protein